MAELGAYAAKARDRVSPERRSSHSIVAAVVACKLGADENVALEMDRLGYLKKQRKPTEGQRRKRAINESPAQALHTAQAIPTVPARHIAH